MKLLVLPTFLIVCMKMQFTLAQITIMTGIPVDQLVQNEFMGLGVQVSNISYVGDSSQFGYFSGASAVLGFPDGIILSSGKAENSVPPNYPSSGFSGLGDAQLLATLQSSTYNPNAGNILTTTDAAIFEFDAIPNADTLRFRFVFASEEYPYFMNTVFNDIIAVYVSGMNPSGGDYIAQNIVTVPGTAEPITISSINANVNNQYYVANPGNVGVSFNGYTIPIEVVLPVVCGESYHFKFGVADGSDLMYDSGFYLEAGSFSTGVPLVTYDTVSACSPYIWIDGNTYTSSNASAQTVLQNTQGCDSIVQLNLTILNTPGVTYDVVNACDSFTWIDGNMYVASDSTAQFVLQNAQGCDSVIQLDLTIWNMTGDITIIDDTVLVASVFNANYQWINCSNGFPIPGATNQTFVPIQNGNYAVVTELNGCQDTSACVSLTVLKLDDLTSLEGRLYPNPFSTQLALEFENPMESVRLEIVDLSGRKLEVHEFENGSKFILNTVIPVGAYLMHVQADNQLKTFYMIKGE